MGVSYGVEAFITVGDKRRRRGSVKGHDGLMLAVRSTNEEGSKKCLADCNFMNTSVSLKRTFHSFFFPWGMSNANSSSYHICGHTVLALRKNVIVSSQRIEGHTRKAW